MAKSCPLRQPQWQNGNGYPILSVTPPREINMSEQTPPTREEWRDMRRDDREAHRAWRRSGYGGPAVGGVILIVIALVLLAQNLGFHLPDNWWAAFLLIPAGGSLVAAVRAYREDGSFSRRASGGLIAGLIFLGLAIALYLGVNWGLLWPVILLVIGIALVARGYVRR
jgi:uncharacterized membrane protein